jgi:hypothetical protein
VQVAVDSWRTQGSPGCHTTSACARRPEARRAAPRRRGRPCKAVLHVSCIVARRPSTWRRVRSEITRSCRLPNGGDDSDKRTRRRVGSRRHEGTRSGTESRKGTTQEKGKAMFLTAVQRCRCHRLDRDGGAARMFAAALGFSFCSGLPVMVGVSSSPAASVPTPPSHGRPPAAARRWRHSARLVFPGLHSPASLALCSQEKGENPNAGWWETTATPGSPYRVEREGGAPIGGHGATADVAPHQWWPRRL